MPRFFAAARGAAGAFLDRRGAVFVRDGLAAARRTCFRFFACFAFLAILLSSNF